MILRIDPESPIPPYEQIRSQIEVMIATGVLPIGTRLPAIRQLAADLGLASGTVARAYRELEALGEIVTRGRHGTFVERNGTAQRGVSKQMLSDAARSFAIHARQAGASADEALEAARVALFDVA